jgi:endonuclease/exonuclease/phosphatase family metal-dependent hydrolase
MDRLTRGILAPGLLIRVALVTVLLAAGPLLVACGSKKDDGGSGASAGEPMKLKVMVYSIEYGGNTKATSSTVKAIKAADADVVGVVEAYDELPRIAKETGYPYYNISQQLLSKYPVYEPADSGGLYVFVEVQPGHVIAACNIATDYVEDGPTALKRGKPVDEVIATERDVRASALTAQTNALSQLAKEGVPVFLTGDFSEPSSLDYTTATVGTQPQIKEPVAWPISEDMQAAGFHDSFRDVYPDPVANPGFTFPADQRGRSAKGLNDRIDFVYAAGPGKTTASEIMGEAGGPEVSITVTPWTSDHRAVISSFEVTPAATPTMVGVSAQLLTAGDSLTVYYDASGTSGNKVALVKTGGDPASALETRDAPGERGHLKFATGSLDASGHEALLVGSDGAVISRVPFWVRARKATVKLTIDKSTYKTGEPILVGWSEGPANRWDWIGVYKASASDPNVDYYLLWDYTGLHASGTVPPTVYGSLTIGEDSQGKPWPLPPGDYVVHYLLTDAYTSAGSAKFTVTK